MSLVLTVDLACKFRMKVVVRLFATRCRWRIFATQTTFRPFPICLRQGQSASIIALNPIRISLWSVRVSAHLTPQKPLQSVQILRTSEWSSYSLESAICHKSHPVHLGAAPIRYGPVIGYRGPPCWLAGWFAEHVGPNRTCRRHAFL